jgi:nucleolar protein 53
MSSDKTVVAPATYSQPSRKGKKAWRKNVDITDVSSGLDNLREEIIIQGGPVKEKTADELFTTDVAGDEAVEKRQRSSKVLKVDEILAQRSKVAGLEPQRKRKAEDHSGSGPGGKRVKNGQYISHRELQRLRNVADGGKIGIILDDQADGDLWGAPAKTEHEQYDFLEPPKKKVEPKSLKQAPIPMTATGKAVRNVLKPNAGKSYNPTVGDWSALLEKEGQVAVDAEKARLAAEAAQAERDRIAAEEAAKAEAVEKDEYATDYESAWESEWDGIQSENERDGGSSLVHKLSKRKTPAERNKVKARKEREAREKWEKKQKEKEAQAARVKQIAREVAANELARNQRLHVKSADAAAVAGEASESDEDVATAHPLRRRRFGQVEIPDAPVEVVLPDDLQDSLRRLKPEGNLLLERYRSKIINGELEPRKKVGQVKKKQTFRTEKWTYKDWKLK